MNDEKELLLDLQRAWMLESSLYKGQENLGLAQKLNDARAEQLRYIKEIGKRGNPALIVAVEKIIVTNELNEHANSKGMVSSLKAALVELTAAEKLLEIVDDPVKYRAIDQAYSIPKNRERGLPLDEARQAFRSHTARLNNLDKARLPDNEKKIIDARKIAVSNAAKLYAQRQAKTLGVEL
jgi:hypothetical protein